MTTEHKPLSAAEIEDLRELEAKATPGEWRADINGCGWVYTRPGSGDTSKIRCDREEHAALIAAMRNALPRLLSMLTPPADATVPVEIFSAVTCNKCKRAWVGYKGCLTEPLPCGHMRSQWAVGSAVVDDMVAASCVRNKSMEDVDDDDEE